MPATITKDMTLTEIIDQVPAAPDIMLDYGLHCFGCAFNGYETLEQGILGHGMSEGDLETILRELNEASEDLPTLTVKGITLTERALRKIEDIQEEESKTGWLLQVDFLKNEQGDRDFFLDFIEAPKKTYTPIRFESITLVFPTKAVKSLEGLQIDYTTIGGEEGFRFVTKKS